MQPWQQAQRDQQQALQAQQAARQQQQMGFRNRPRPAAAGCVRTLFGVVVMVVIVIVVLLLLGHRF